MKIVKFKILLTPFVDSYSIQTFLKQEDIWTFNKNEIIQKFDKIMLRGNLNLIIYENNKIRRE